MSEEKAQKFGFIGFFVLIVSLALFVITGSIIFLIVEAIVFVVTVGFLLIVLYKELFKS